MSAGSALSDISIVLAGVAAAGTLYYGWSRRVADAAKAPFLAGEAAIADAKAALEFRGRLIEELTAQVEALRRSKAETEAQLATALATAKVQLEELTKVQARLYTLEGENRDLMARAQAEESAAQSARARLTDLEEKWEALQRKMHLGPDAF